MPRAVGGSNGCLDGDSADLEDNLEPDQTTTNIFSGHNGDPFGYYRPYSGNNGGSCSLHGTLNRKDNNSGGGHNTTLEDDVFEDSNSGEQQQQQQQQRYRRQASVPANPLGPYSGTKDRNMIGKSNFPLPRRIMRLFAKMSYYLTDKRWLFSLQQY